MTNQTHEIEAERATCPSCGAFLTLRAEQAILQCKYCGTNCKVVRRLRRLDPNLPSENPVEKYDLNVEFSHWNTAQLMTGILSDETLERKLAMAKALDAWPHVNETAVKYLAAYVKYMLSAPPELDKAMCGIVGKLICSDKLEFVNAVIRAGQQYGYVNPGSQGLLFALSLGSAATVKLLLDIGEWASVNGTPDYTEKALQGVRTAIGRSGSEDRHVCNRIAINRLPDVTTTVRDWILYHIHLEFDVGYTQHRGWVLSMIDDMASEKPELVPLLQESMRRCGGAKDVGQWESFLRAIPIYRTDEARLSALKTLNPRHDTPPEKAELAVRILKPYLNSDLLGNAAAEVLGKIVYLGEDVPESIIELMNELGDSAPRPLLNRYNTRVE
ncbi:MAG: hypothetical protein L3J82_03990 [Planctomycetes bacterium]|nr:hypothetical protein [Planctomycetota bacterium]